MGFSPRWSEGGSLFSPSSPVFLRVFSLFLPRFSLRKKLISLSTTKRKRKNREKEVICPFLLGEKGEENSLIRGI
jgi:hypothetical protein